ncbi:hypothetical protein [Desulfobacca acetoxidans]|uniref:Nucleic acid binding OB-fold tRNA/helicase-type n=1 Tax=Desulfobacca acetoxidans (strain ATCC 700848 / DSM 11109 / ASRB2) TaxID=880072 RepID=F2NE15_DESAR|nr:hypothetical protein [Desulfobacca acetoxidans]AEB10583.1 nucleic acid binding OB-fold tRNA/helicase-type [Desulfobacca acetoxidans DSM 11109]
MPCEFRLVLPAFFLALVLGLGSEAWAQGGRFYDPQTVVTVKGQVEKLEVINRRGGAAPSGRQVQLIQLKTAQGTFLIHLGPSWFMEQQKLAPQVGDSLEVTGSKVSTRRGEVIMAAEVTWHGKTLKLRDAQGTPVWRGQGGGRQRPGGPTQPQ